MDVATNARRATPPGSSVPHRNILTPWMRRLAAFPSAIHFVSAVRGRPARIPPARIPGAGGIGLLKTSRTVRKALAKSARHVRKLFSLTEDELACFTHKLNSCNNRSYYTMKGLVCWSKGRKESARRSFRRREDHRHHGILCNQVSSPSSCSTRFVICSTTTQSTLQSAFSITLNTSCSILASYPVLSP